LRDDLRQPDAPVLFAAHLLPLDFAIQRQECVGNRRQMISREGTLRRERTVKIMHVRTGRGALI